MPESREGGGWERDGRGREESREKGRGPPQAVPPIGSISAAAVGWTLQSRASCCIATAWGLVCGAGPRRMYGLQRPPCPAPPLHHGHQAPHPTCLQVGRGPDAKIVLAVPDLKVHPRPGSTVPSPLALSKCGPSGMLFLPKTDRGHHCPLHRLRPSRGHTRAPASTQPACTSHSETFLTLCDTLLGSSLNSPTLSAVMPASQPPPHPPHPVSLLTRLIWCQREWKDIAKS